MQIQGFIFLGNMPGSGYRGLDYEYITAGILGDFTKTHRVCRYTAGTGGGLSAFDFMDALSNQAFLNRLGVDSLDQFRGLFEARP